MRENQNNIKIRKMVKDDLAFVNAVDSSIPLNDERRVTSWHFPFDIYWENYKSSIIGYVAELDGQVAGFLAGTIKQEERSKSLVVRPHEGGYIKQDRKIGWIEVMGVKPEVWHKGIGTLLIKAFEDECKANNATMRIILKNDDKKTVNYFHKNGFAAPEFITLEKKS